MPINVTDIRNYFNYLSTYENPDTEIFTYCLLDIESKNVILGHGVKFGTIEEILEDCKWQERVDYKPFTLHTTLNSTKLTGRRTKDIEAVRVLCVDFDREVPKQSLKPLILANKVQMVVESSPGKYHFYWKINPECPPNMWRDYQLGLNQYFGGDIQMASIAHTIRVPGVSRVTKEGKDFMPAIVYLAEEQPVFDGNDIKILFPWVLDKAEEAENKLKEKKRIIGRTIKQIKKGDTDYKKAITESDRNSTLFSLIFALTAESTNGIYSLTDAQIAGSDFNEALSAHLKGPLPQDELIKTVESAFERGLIAREKRKAREERKTEHLERILGVNSSVCGEGVLSDVITNIGFSDHIEINGVKHMRMHTNGHSDNGVEVIEANSRFEYNFSSGDLRDSPYTDYGITERVIQRFGDCLIRTGAIVYAFDRRELIWRSQKGCPTVVHDYVAEVCREVVREEGFLNECKNDDGEISLAKFTREKRRFLGNTFLMQAVTVLLSSPKLVTKSIKTFDSNTYLYYLANGILDFSMVEKGIVPAQATDYLLKRADIRFDPKAVCPEWEKFLEEVFAENEAPGQMISFIQEVFGYSLTGDVEEQALFLHSGGGSNGKSRVLYALGQLAGDYSARLQSNALTKSKNAVGKEIERIGAKIEGRRVVIIDDLDTRTQWNDGLVKALTEKTIVSRRLYEEEKDIPNRAKFHIACNETPSVDGNSFAMFRRVSIIEYNRTFEPDALKLKAIDAAIDREISGILNWAITGFRRLQARGKLERPEEVLVRIEDYKEANQGADVILPELFEKTNDSEEWHTLSECVQHANQKAPHMGYPGAIFKPETLGRELTKLGFKQQRRRLNGIQKRGYCTHFADSL